MLFTVKKGAVVINALLTVILVDSIKMFLN